MDLKGADITPYYIIAIHKHESQVYIFMVSYADRKTTFQTNIFVFVQQAFIMWQFLDLQKGGLGLFDTDSLGHYAIHPSSIVCVC